MKYLYTFIIILALSLVLAAKAGAQTPGPKDLNSINYLLAVDRLDFYSDGLADYLQDHQKANVAEAIRQISPEEFHRQMYSMTDLNNTDLWNQLVLQTLQKKFPEFSKLTVADIEWHYNFFRKKLMEGFKADPVSLKKESALAPNHQSRIAFEERDIPALDGSKILLDAERYISEKTTRGIFWDAATTGKNIEFHIGTERDFRQRVQIEGREVVAEVKTRASNYNKIYLVFDPVTQTSSYAFTRISGSDRVTHLMAQLEILQFQQKSALKKVRVYGNAEAFHLEQEKALTEIFKTLPKADLVVIGQKSAMENVIATAGMMAQVQPDTNVELVTTDKQMQKLSALVGKTNSYFSITSKGNVVKSYFENFPNPEAANYEVMNLEQPSHDVTDILLQDQNGGMQRWRLISNMWGDEVVPVAEALKNSGHNNIVYIGTAGAIRGKGLKVGDVVTPAQTYTQDGRLLNLEKSTYGNDFVKPVQALGQVRSPFDETQNWFDQWSDKVEVVELETGYLRDHLGDGVSFQPYLLVSDVVGSEHETLAVAANDSGKRKNGQLKLLESLFIQNHIKMPIANFRPIPNDEKLADMMKRIETLRPSRDITSRMQLAQLAIRQGLQSNDDLEALIKAEPAFDRQLLSNKLEGASDILKTLAQQHPDLHFTIVGPKEVLNGTWNAKQALVLQVMVTSMNANEARPRFTAAVSALSAKAGGQFGIEWVDYDSDLAMHGVAFNQKTENVLGSYYEDVVLKKAGLVKEYDKTGGVRFRQIHEFSRGMRCEAVML